VTNQRIEAWPILGNEDGRDRAISGCVGSQAIYRFSPECDKRAGAQQRSRACDSLAISV
jgi:hypothetical protein